MCTLCVMDDAIPVFGLWDVQEILQHPSSCSARRASTLASFSNCSASNCFSLAAANAAFASSLARAAFSLASAPLIAAISHFL